MSYGVAEQINIKTSSGAVEVRYDTDNRIQLIVLSTAGLTQASHWLTPVEAALLGHALLSLETLVKRSP